jgi:hypothetical protein
MLVASTDDGLGSHDFHFESASRSPRLSCASGRIKLFGASRALAILTAIGRISRPSACSLDGRFKRVRRYPSASAAARLSANTLRKVGRKGR